MPKNGKPKDSLSLKRVYDLKKLSKEQEDKAYELGDGYHADMPGSTPASDRKMYRHMDRSEKLDKKARELFKKVQNKKEMEKDNPIKYMEPMVHPAEGGFKMKMGSKERFSDGNFSQKDSELINSAPALMKDNWGGESIELKDQESPIAYRGQTKFKEEAPSQGALALKMADKRTEQNAQGLQNALSITSAVADLAKSAKAILDD